MCSRARPLGVALLARELELAGARFAGVGLHRWTVVGCYGPGATQALGNYTREVVRTCCQRLALVEFVAGRLLLSGETDDGGVVLELLVARVEHRSVNLADRVGSGAVV
jgi:hypothetical protein